MSLLLAALLSFQQTDDELRALVERFNQAIRAEDHEGKGLPWNEVRRAGPAVVKHLVAAFPGRHLPLLQQCPSMGWEREREYPLVSLLVFAFKDHALPHLIALTRDPDPEKTRIAAAVLRHFPVKEIVAPLIEFSKSRDLTSDAEVKWTVLDVLTQTTFLRFGSLEELETWYAAAKARTQSDWLREAIDHAEPGRIARDYAIRGACRLLDSPGRLKALLHCFVDLEWREAGFALYSATGHSIHTQGKHLWDPWIMAREREAWAAFRKLPEADQQIEIALHSADGHSSSLPGSLMMPAQACDFLLAHAEQAFDYLEKTASRHPHCAGAFSASLRLVATSKNWDRVQKLAPAMGVQEPYIRQILEFSRHPSMADLMFEMVLSGEVEKFGFRNLSVVFGRRARPDMIPKILEAFSRSKELVRDSLIGALAELGDPRGWDILKKEVFSNPIWIGRSIQMIENFAGDDAMAELRRLLKESPPSQALYAARVLADRGNFSGVPHLIRELDFGGMKDVRIAFWWLSQIRGRWPAKEGLPVDPWPGQEAIAEMKSWWEKNKSRSRVDWLLDSLEEGATSMTPWGAIENPLSILAKEELMDIPTYPQVDWYRRKVAERVRAWVKKTGLTFDKNTLRVRHQPQY